MTNLLRANLFRLRHTMVFWGAMAVSVGFSAFLIYTHLSDQARYGTEFLLDQVFFAYVLTVGFLQSVVVSTFLGTEYSDGTVRNKMVVGRLRRDVYLSNLITLTGAGFLFSVAFMLTAIVLGAPFAGLLTVSGRVIALTLLGSLLLEAAFCAVYTFISMNCSHKATTAILCILLFFGMMIASTYVAARLDAEPERLTYEMINGEFVSSMEPNPRYLQGTERAVYEFFYDFLPTGQASQYFAMEFVHPLRMMLCSVFIVAASTLGGLTLFKRKDLK